MGGRIQSIELSGKKIDIGAYQFAGFDNEAANQNELYKLIKE